MIGKIYIIDSGRCGSSCGLYGTWASRSIVAVTLTAMSGPCAPDTQHSTVAKWLSHSAGPEACTRHDLAAASSQERLIAGAADSIAALLTYPGVRLLSLVQWLWPVLEMELPQAKCCRSASGDVDMMEVMVGARVESDRARSALDG